MSGKFRENFPRLYQSAPLSGLTLKPFRTKLSLQFIQHNIVTEKNTKAHISTLIFLLKTPTHIFTKRSLRIKLKKNEYTLLSIVEPFRFPRSTLILHKHVFLTRASCDSHKSLLSTDTRKDTSAGDGVAIKGLETEGGRSVFIRSIKRPSRNESKQDKNETKSSANKSTQLIPGVFHRGRASAGAEKCLTSNGNLFSSKTVALLFSLMSYGKLPVVVLSRPKKDNAARLNCNQFIWKSTTIDLRTRTNFSPFVYAFEYATFFHWWERPCFLKIAIKFLFNRKNICVSI